MIESQKIYSDIGYANMYDFMIQHCGYSHGSCYRRLEASRLLKQVPEIKSDLQSGALNLTQLAQVQKAFKHMYTSQVPVSKDIQSLDDQLKNSSSNESSSQIQTKTLIKVPSDLKLEVLKSVVHKSTQETEKILCEKLNIGHFKENKVTHHKSEEVTLTITLTKAQYEKLQKAKTLISHQAKTSEMSEIITALSESYLHKKLGKNKSLAITRSIAPVDLSRGKVSSEANRFKEKTTLISTECSQSTDASAPASVRASAGAGGLKRSRRIYLSRKIKNHLFYQAQFQCEHINHFTRQRCTQKTFLDVDHRKALSLNGTNDTSNLRILCRQHNLKEYELDLQLHL